MSFRVMAKTGIQASVDTVWEVLIDFERWGQWMPIHPEFSADGPIRFGARLVGQEALGGQVRPYAGTLLDWEPYAQLVFAENKPRGLFQSFTGHSVRFIELDALTKDACQVSMGEVFEGFLTKQRARKSAKLYRSAFEETLSALESHVTHIKARSTGAV